MPTITRKAVFQAVRTKFASPAQRKGLSQKLGKSWNYASTEALAQAVGLQSAPRKSIKGATRAKSTTQQHGFARSFASENAAKNLSDNETKRALIKGRLVRSIKRAVTAKEKGLGRKLERQEKKAVAARAFASEYQAIKKGEPEKKPVRGNKAKAQKKASFSHTPPPGVSVADHRAQLRRQYGAETGDRTENLSKKEQRRAEVSRGDGGNGRTVRAKVANSVSEPKASGLLTPKMKRKEITYQTGGNGSRSGYSSQRVTRPSYLEVGDHKVVKTHQSLHEVLDANNNLVAQVATREGAIKAAQKEATRLARVKVADDIPFGSTTTAKKPPARQLDGKLNNDQQKAIAAHLRKVESGDALSVPIRALQDKSGQHWLEMRSATGRVGAVPIDERGRKDNDRAVHSQAWDARSEGMKTISEFPEARKGKAVEVEVMPPEAKKTDSKKQSAGDRIRATADFLSTETGIQKKATARILGAVGKMAQNHDRLIDEVVDMVNEDLGKGKKGRTEDRQPVFEPPQAQKAKAVEVMPTGKKQSAGDRLRAVADSLSAETGVQKKATARIIGAAAQMAQNHDRLIDEVVEMVNEDLDKPKRKAKKLTRGTKTKPWAGDTAPTAIAQPRAKTIRGRTID